MGGGASTFVVLNLKRMQCVILLIIIIFVARELEIVCFSFYRYF